MGSACEERRFMFSVGSCLGSIVVEFLDDNPYTLATTRYPLPQPNVFYEYVTLTSQHSPVSSRLFQWFRAAVSNCDHNNGPRVIAEMVEVFREYRDDLSIPLKEYVLTEGIIEVCYRIQIEDSDLMKEVLNLLYESWSSFGSLHFSAILKPSHVQEMRGRSQATPDFLAFYLEHARVGRLEYRGVRFIDVSVYSSIDKSPVFIAADIWCWKPLLRYLQYGARFEDMVVDPSTTRNGVRSALTDSFRILVRHLWIRLVQPAVELSLEEPRQIREYCERVNQREMRDLVKTVRVILRAVRCLRTEDVRFTFRDHSTDHVVEVDSRTVLQHPAVRLLLPTLEERHSCPVQLQHACRWAVRRRLNENWELPIGIQSLPVPPSIKKYLNLLSG